MKQILFTLLLFCTVGLLSCRKNNNDVDIKTYDEQQIQTYISANGLTGMSRDLTSGDTTGIYYKILSQGTGETLSYASTVSLVLTAKSLDGQFSVTDTILTTSSLLATHIYNYVGHLSANVLPQGVELALVNIAKKKGTRIRLLIPSRLAYGRNGAGSGSSTSSNRVAGNQSMDFYINIINDQNTYDDQSVAKYIAANNLTGYTPITSGDYKGLYYKITQQGTGAVISNQSIVSIQYTGYLLNGAMTADQYNSTDGYGVNIDLATDPRKGIVGGLLQTLPGAKVSLIMPSRLAYGATNSSDIPPYSCLRYEINVLSVQ